MFRWAGNKIMETLGDVGYFDRYEASKISDKYIPGLELHLSSDYFQEYDFDSVTSAYSKTKVGILYKLPYGEIGARVLCKSSPIAQFIAIKRVLKYKTGFELTAMGDVEIYKHRLDKWKVGATFILGNSVNLMELKAAKFVLSTRHRIHPKLVVLSQANIPFINPSRKTTLALGLEWVLNSSTTVEVMCSERHPPVFSLQYQFSRPHCLVRFSGDVYSKRTGVSFAFHPYSF